MDGEKKQKKEISLEELFQRAEAADSSEKYNISSNYYFLILSRHISKISTDKNKYNSVLYKFIFDTIMCTNVTQKERLMNYLYQNDKLGVAELKPIFEKFINYQILYLDDLKSLMKDEIEYEVMNELNQKGEFDDDSEDEDKWFPKYKDCECCHGFVYKCPGESCKNLGQCYCKMKDEVDNDDGDKENKQ